MRRLVADVDTGIDDMLALIYLAARHRAGEIELAGVTTVAGNTTVDTVAVNTRWVLDLCGCSDIPVGVGPAAPVSIPLTTTPETHGDYGLGYARPPREVSERLSVDGGGSTSRILSTTDVWEAALQDGSADLVATGPLTSVAMNPELVSRFNSLTIMGGAVDYRGNTTPTAEWNFWVDPDAVAMTLREARQRGWDVTLCHLGVTETIMVTPDDVARWGLPGELGTLVKDALRFYFEFHDNEGIGYCAQVHDLLAVMVALDAVNYGTADKALVAVPDDRGAITTVGSDGDARGQATREDVAPDKCAMVHVLDSVDPDDVRAETERVFAILTPSR
ncbi:MULTISPECIES: nucleoside hydrolase [Corynebacterium]|uniref:nucleoside hydrolase n=1 Tax=Corynebacterium TaxID=1716 RepID=UPI001958C029|nr:MULTISPECIES: nucleoside hydrolase [Corynebacterium]MDN8624126.1 nucleoside hydrolase [Corynebacterium kroppenstedtii]QRQ65839.1 nucleoside hydrolase [Corynebacterium kroppenstedtii]